MPAYAIFDVEILDPVVCRDFMAGVSPALEKVSAKYLARGGAHKVHEGDWVPRRMVLLEFPSMGAFETFYQRPTYQGLKKLLNGCGSARRVSLEGLP